MNRYVTSVNVTAKLRQIRTVIEKENLKLYEAAALFGYTDANYVSSLYKKIFGKNIMRDARGADKGETEK